MVNLTDTATFQTIKKVPPVWVVSLSIIMAAGGGQLLNKLIGPDQELIADIAAIKLQSDAMKLQMAALPQKIAEVVDEKLAPVLAELDKLDDRVDAHDTLIAVAASHHD